MTTRPSFWRTVIHAWRTEAWLVAIVIAVLVGWRFGAGGDEPTPAQADVEAAAGTPAEPQLYTCSMHPSVQLEDPDALCPICFMELIPMTEDAAGPNELALSADAAARSGIETARVARFFPTAEVRLYGAMTYDETQVSRLTSYVPGRIDRLFVNYVGVPVARGDHLAELYSPDVLAAFDELRIATESATRSAESSEMVRRSAERSVRAARERLRLLGVRDDQIAAAEAGTTPGDRLTIYAPRAGVVTHVAVREGDYIATGAPIATVADLTHLWLDLEAYESQLPLLRWGQRVRFDVAALPERHFEGRISFIEPVVDARTRTSTVRVAVQNADGALKPGMYATATVRARIGAGGAVVSDELAGRWVAPMHPTIVRDHAGTCDICGMDLVPAESLGIVGDPASVSEPLVIPRTAALVTGRRAVVYVEVPDAETPTYESRTIRLGARAGAFYLVESGLDEGESVVVNGAFRLDSAMQIASKPSMMLPGHDDTAGSTANDSRDDVPDAFLYALKPVYAAYLAAQDALAHDDHGGFLQAAGDLTTALDFVPEHMLVGETLGAWRRAAGPLGGQESARTIDDARVRFDGMSEAILALSRRFGHYGSETWHEAFCPMAFDDRGARWLQRGTTISNPYFGASMLRCGEIRSALAPRAVSGEADDDD